MCINKVQPKKEEWVFYGNCVTGGIQIIRKKDINKIKTFCEMHGDVSNEKK
jgi:hypothetical protein